MTDNHFNSKIKNTFSVKFDVMTEVLQNYDMTGHASVTSANIVTNIFKFWVFMVIAFTKSFFNFGRAKMNTAVPKNSI